MANRKWKETKQLPGTAGPGNMIGSCLVSFHFLWHPMSAGCIDFDDRGHAVNQLSFTENRWSIRANKQARLMARGRGEVSSLKLKSVYLTITTKFSKLVLLLGQFTLRDALRQFKRGGEIGDAFLGLRRRQYSFGRVGGRDQ